ncbi:MAG: DUF4294 domain-containing protein [Candidatus Azobacteroides sp.]|nr:DUF4294 domain-containing protein [Candidatus Azobacteroides sp.]
MPIKNFHILYSLFLLMFLASENTFAQQPEKYSPYTENGDSIMMIVLSDIPVYPPTFKNEKQIMEYNKLIRDVKKTLPYAKMIYATLIETCEYVETLPKNQREAHIKRMEKDLFEQYKPVMKQMTLTQGKLLIRLIDRECNQTSYDLAKAFLGPIRAGFWNFFAGMFGASLKSTWEPEGKDAEAERIVRLVEAGVL